MGLKDWKHPGNDNLISKGRPNLPLQPECMGCFQKVRTEDLRDCESCGRVVCVLACINDTATMCHHCKRTR